MKEGSMGAGVQTPRAYMNVDGCGSLPVIPALERDSDAHSKPASRTNQTGELRTQWRDRPKMISNTKLHMHVHT